MNSEYEVWLDVSLPHLKPVFEFMVQGSENRMGRGVSRTVHATAILDSHTETIDVQLQVPFSMYNHDLDLGFETYMATYGRARTNRGSHSEKHIQVSEVPNPFRKKTLRT